MADEIDQNQQGYLDPNNAASYEQQQYQRGQQPVGQPYIQQPMPQPVQQQNLYGIHNRGRRITFDFEMDTELNNVMRAGPLFDMRYGAAPTVGSTMDNVPMVIGEEKKRSSFKIPLLILALILIGIGGFMIYGQFMNKQTAMPATSNEPNGFGYPNEMAEPIQGLPTPTSTQQRPYTESDEFIMPEELDHDFPDSPEHENMLPPAAPTAAGAEAKPQAARVKSQYQVQPVVYKPNNGISNGTSSPYSNQRQDGYQMGYGENQGRGSTNTNDYRKVNIQDPASQTAKQNPNAGYYAPPSVVPDSSGFSYAPNYQQIPK